MMQQLRFTRESRLRAAVEAARHDAALGIRYGGAPAVAESVNS